MRKDLTEYTDTRGTFTGTFVRMGQKNGYKGPVPTVLLKDVKNVEGKVLTDHLWFNYTKGFQSLGELKEGDIVQFNARCKEYEKGYNGYRADVYKPIEIDYKLSHPSKILRIMSDDE